MFNDSTSDENRVVNALACGLAFFLIGMAVFVLLGRQDFRNAVPAPELIGKFQHQSVDRLKTITQAMHAYHNRLDHFPEASADAPFPYSWRVAILPDLHEEALLDEYHFDQPWDSPENLKLVAKMPEVFAHPKDDPTDGKTAYYVVTGRDTIFPPGGSTNVEEITDGASDTILVVEARRDVPWTKPEDIDYDSKHPSKMSITEWKSFLPDSFNVSFADGSVRSIKTTIAPHTLRALVSKSGHEAFPVVASQ